MAETPARQKANAEVRKGTKRPEHGAWPVASQKHTEKVAKKMHSMAKKSRKTYPWQGDTDKPSKPYTFKPKNS